MRFIVANLIKLIFLKKEQVQLAILLTFDAHNMQFLEKKLFKGFSRISMHTLWWQSVKASAWLWTSDSVMFIVVRELIHL